MTLKDTADLATALTLVVATVTFVLALIEHRQRERDKRIQNWQKVVVYKLIEDGASEFNEIKVLYVTEARQFSEFNLPQQEIQDSALRLALMSLLSERLISKSAETGGFLINVVSTQESKIKDLAMIQIQQKMAQNLLVTRLYEKLDNESGRYTTDQLYRALDAASVSYKFEDFDNLVREQVQRGGIVSDNQSQKLWLRAKLPQVKPK